mmetsp:Transcript_7986/g.19888  ORF Transcript_7986/g.19888 Transcript_7986/m.19888 type:complete len:351 (+) Transcript_7986:1216-2268(+)
MRRRHPDPPQPPTDHPVHRSPRIGQVFLGGDRRRRRGGGDSAPDRPQADAAQGPADLPQLDRERVRGNGTGPEPEAHQGAEGIERRPAGGAKRCQRRVSGDRRGQIEKGRRQGPRAALQGGRGCGGGRHRRRAVRTAPRDRAVHADPVREGRRRRGLAQQAAVPRFGIERPAEAERGSPGARGLRALQRRSGRPFFVPQAVGGLSPEAHGPVHVGPLQEHTERPADAVRRPGARCVRAAVAVRRAGRRQPSRHPGGGPGRPGGQDLPQGRGGAAGPRPSIGRGPDSLDDRPAVRRLEVRPAERGPHREDRGPPVRPGDGLRHPGGGIALSVLQRRDGVPGRFRGRGWRRR